MRIPSKNENEGRPSQTEELEVNGASLVFYTVKVLKNPIDNITDTISKVSDHFTIFTLSQGYIEKILSLNADASKNHLFFKCSQKTILPNNEIGSIGMIKPSITHYITLYAKSIILIQSVIMFDKQQIIRFESPTNIDHPIMTSDILEIIRSIKDNDNDWNTAFKREIDRITGFFVEFLGRDNNIDTFINISDKNQQCLSVQIWDIASKHFKDDDEVNGTELADCYELELSAILSCYNEHFITNGLWKKQSANQVHRSVLSKTDVLVDHQVLLSERVCVEISQVNHPTLRSISHTRLVEYGYDSTSIFLWGYIVIMGAIFEVCNMKADALHSKIMNNTLEQIWTKKENMDVVYEKQNLKKELEQHAFLKTFCIEERHKDFIEKGINIRGLMEIQSRIKGTFEEIHELSNLFVATDTSTSSDEISELLKEVKELNKKNGKVSVLLTMISILVGILAVTPLANRIGITYPSLTILKILFFILIGVGVSLLFFVSVLLPIFRKKEKK